MTELKDRWALVTGASSGLGVDFARQLAALGCHTALVARREERLREVAEGIGRDHGVETLVLPMSLSAKDAPRELHARLAERGVAVDVLVNNAGFGLYGDFVDLAWEREHEMLELDIVALVQLTKLFVKDMLARNFGRVLQVASIGAFSPSPSYASYAAAKSFVLHFGEALAYELRNTNVSVTVVSPGITATEFLQVSGQTPSLYQRLTLMSSESVARIALRAMRRGRPSVVPGLVNALSTWSLRFTPRRAATALAHTLMNTGQRS